MIEEYEKFNLIDADGRKTGITMEVNWNPEDKETNKCKIIRMTLPGGKQVFVKKELLNSFLFIIGKPSEQRKMIPVQMRRSRHYETVISSKATKDIRKGEDIVQRIVLTLPTFEEEAIIDLAKDYRKAKRAGIIIPSNIKGRVKTK